MKEMMALLLIAVGGSVVASTSEMTTAAARIVVSVTRLRSLTDGPDGVSGSCLSLRLPVSVFPVSCCHGNSSRL